MLIDWGLFSEVALERASARYREDCHTKTISGRILLLA
jgi:hypothetical protein